MDRNVAVDVCILGAGVIGLSLAWELAKRGARVQIFERDEPGQAASWAAGGMLAPFSEELPVGDLLDLACASLTCYPRFVANLIDETGIDPHLRLNGICEVAFDTTHLARLERRVAVAQRRGVAMRRLSSNDVFTFESAIAASVLGGVHCLEEGQLDNRRLVRALLAACRRRGVRIHTGTEVVALEANRRRVLGVQTVHGFSPATVVVNALGAWADTLSGIPDDARVAVSPVKGQMLALAMPHGFLRHVLWGSGIYAIPREDGRLVVGATVEDVGFDRRMTAEAIASLLRGVMHLLPGAASFALCEMWSGLRPQSGNEMPFLGATSLAGYFVATGHYRNGILLAPITAYRLADLLESGVSARTEPERATILTK